jgi:NADH dehydrogenase (ubiquinone) Fe-S protein 8
MLATANQLPRAMVLVRRAVTPARALVARRGYATPAGPPPSNFRLRGKMDLGEERMSTLDRMGRYFLMTEMFRGMYVALEQFFRPP